GAITPDERATVRQRSPVGAKYDSAVNRESAYELLTQRAQAPTQQAAPTRAPAQAKASKQQESGGLLQDMLFGSGRRQGIIETMSKQAARTVGSQVGRQIMRGLLGGILGGTRRR